MFAFTADTVRVVDIVSKTVFGPIVVVYVVTVTVGAVSMANAVAVTVLRS